MVDGKFVELTGYIDSGPIEHGGQVSRNVHVPGIVSKNLRNIRVPERLLVDGAMVDLSEPLPIAVPVLANPNALTASMLGFRVLAGTADKPER